MKSIISIAFVIIGLKAFGQQSELTLEPPFWWANMQSNELQILVTGAEITNITIDDYEGVRLQSIKSLSNPNYHVINLIMDDNTKAGEFDINFTQKGKSIDYSYELKPRKIEKLCSINEADVIYLITPDRFANADPSNDSTSDTFEKVNRSDIHGRHGGDIKGIANQIDYLKELGITTVWINPLLENNQSTFSYHGYGITDFFRIDSRYGTNEDYIQLINKLHHNGIKIIMDQVFNHCGINHKWISNLPEEDWLNTWPTYTKSNFSNITSSDPYASEYDMNLLTKGWFDTTLPDLNLRNDILRNYLIQNSIWWIEYAHLDGIRMDTYPYPDKNAMAEWVRRVKTEYPNLYIVGETWEHNPAVLSYWNSSTENKDGYNSHLTSISDFPLYSAMLSAFKKDGDIYRVYEVLAQDFVYGNASQNKTFLGNHDVPRLTNELYFDIDKIKMAFTLLLTTRGIPQIYYGDELFFTGTKPDGKIRKDFPGGWSNDKKNLFNASERNKKQTEIFDHVSKLLEIRKSSEEISLGKLVHYRPENNVYVYFRKLEGSAILVIINNSEKSIENFSFEKYQTEISQFSSAKDLYLSTEIDLMASIFIESNSSKIIKLN